MNHRTTVGNLLNEINRFRIILSILNRILQLENYQSQIFTQKEKNQSALRVDTIIYKGNGRRLVSGRDYANLAFNQESWHRGFFSLWSLSFDKLNAIFLHFSYTCFSRNQQNHPAKTNQLSTCYKMRTSTLGSFE